MSVIGVDKKGWKYESDVNLQQVRERRRLADKRKSAYGVGDKMRYDGHVKRDGLLILKTAHTPASLWGKIECALRVLEGGEDAVYPQSRLEEGKRLLEKEEDLQGKEKPDPVKVAQSKASSVLEEARKKVLAKKDKVSAYALQVLIERLKEPAHRLVSEKTFKDLRKLKWKKSSGVYYVEFDTGIEVKKRQLVKVTLETKTVMISRKGGWVSDASQRPNVWLVIVSTDKRGWKSESRIRDEEAKATGLLVIKSPQSPTNWGRVEYMIQVLEMRQ